MDRKGFSLVELLACIALLGVILGIGLYSAKGTLSTTLSTLNGVSTDSIYSASKSYVLENGVTWYHQDIEYTCVKIDDLVDAGYFDMAEVTSYKDNTVKLVRDPITKTITSVSLVDTCGD